MVVRIDARRLTDAAGLYAAVSAAFGFPAGAGTNLDAMVDCLTDLDNPKTGMSRLHVFPGQVALVAIDHTDAHNASQAAQVKSLADVVAFVNWRRLEKGKPPVLAVAYAAG